MKKKIYLLLMLFLFTEYAFSSSTTFITGSKIIKKEEEKKLSIIDLKTGEKEEKTFKKDISILETSPRGNYFAYAYSENILDVYMFNMNNMTSNYFGIKTKADIWSKNGERVVYVYANRIDVINTKNIEKYFSNKELSIRIDSTNEISTINFVSWLGNYNILYYNATGENITLFIFDIKKRKRCKVQECLFNKNGCKKHQINNFDYYIEKIENGALLHCGIENTSQ